ncbi:hypothetical protein F4809DRAFT_624584 [Biscogniauxia mediterranea]|nr:hypothetical protein F4809DRAFT_624584 [Biscogniauxia mediterranea]
MFQLRVLFFSSQEVKALDIDEQLTWSYHKAMSIPQNRQSARKLVRQIAKDHGYIHPEKFQQLEALGAEFRREMEEAYLMKDLLIGSSVVTLAKNLYTSKARFVFELLQNADDNQYTRAAASGSVPYVSFRVYPHQIIVECNEDGFTSENLAAICSVGKSSKTGAQGYIGEKGIGFKSVFMVASKVHIQSGAFSFSFRHKAGESGMGMISPIWEETDEELPSPLTRLTLHLHQTGDPDTLAKTRESTQKQFEELQETVLLFMKNLRILKVVLYDEKLEQTSSTTYSIERPQPTYAILKRTKVANGTTHEDVKYFHVTTHEATNLAKNENRTYSQVEEVTRAYSRSPITLAFPLSETSTPIIEPQDLFVFLPVRRVGFSFLIQADFVTDASRQDVVQDSLRNIGLLNGVADAFVEAVLQFCEHDTLRYQWMRYLPDKNSANWGKLWLSLVNIIASRLTETPVLYDLDGFLNLIGNIFRLGDDMFDNNGEPLFDSYDIISQNYSHSDLNYLREYGLRYAQHPQIIEWVGDDLDKGDSSRMRSPDTSESWHTRVAKFLNYPFEQNLTDLATKVEMLEIIPLEDGTWVSARDTPIYFAKIDGRYIPSDVELPLISKNVVNSDRLALFNNLGVETAEVGFARRMVLGRYLKMESLRSIKNSIKISKSHLEFLYATEKRPSLKKGTKPLYRTLRIHDRDNNLIHPGKPHMYLADDKPYGPWELLRKTDPGPNLGDGAPGFAVPFVNKEYFGGDRTAPSDKTWVDWFIHTLRVKNHVRFTVDDDGTLRGIGKYLQKYRPEKFLGALFVWWNQKDPLFTLPRFVNCIQETKVLCRGNRQVLLKEAYFPTEELERRVGRFVGQSVFFPWLWIDAEAIPDASPVKWKSLLTELEVGFPSTDLDFALDMLKYYLDAFPTTITSSNTARLFELYDHIQAKYHENENRVTAREKIRKVFSERKCIYIPRPEACFTWAFPHECVWNAPQDMVTKFALKRLVGACFCRDGADCSHFDRFFFDTLGITECTWEVYIEELKALKASGCDNIDTITAIYEEINVLLRKQTSKESVKNAFENDALIYVPPLDDGQVSAAWHKISHCVWSKAARLRGRVSLNDDYEHLEELFVQYFGIQPVDLPMAIDELNEAGKRMSTSISEVKESIWTVNSLLSAELDPPKPSGILKSAIFPVTYPQGDVTRETMRTEFFIVDREPLWQSFKTKVKFLDFTLEEVVRLSPFLAWTRLDDRYVSRCIKEITSFPGGGASIISNPDRQIRNRAHPLLRIASHFSSPRTQSTRDLESLYQVLRTSGIWEADYISSDFQLSQDGTLHVVENKKMTLHIDEDQSGLKVYVPRDKDDQQYQFTNVLSQKLFEWMMRHPLTQISEGVNKIGVQATRDILLAPRSRIAIALEDNGIAPVDIANIDEDVPEPESLTTPREVSEESPQDSTSGDHGDDSEEEIIDTPASSMGSPFPGGRSAVAASRRRHSRPPMPASIGEYLSTPSASPSPAPEPRRAAGSPTHDRQYVAILDKVITAARRSTLPSHGSFDMSQIHAHLPNATEAIELGLRAASQFERNCKIGAAGELYVFELLSQLFASRYLLRFARDNWKSNVRRYVAAHPAYADMEPWSGQETSDITYRDGDGALTDVLVEKGYLARDAWAGKRPDYFIEVKTTTAACDTPFFMSKAQYQRMRDNVLTADNVARNNNNPSRIYAIFRVYHLGQDNMGLRIYFDPESLRLSGKLEFTAETWSVVPVEVIG